MKPLAQWRDHRATLYGTLCLLLLTTVSIRPEIRGLDGGGNYVYLMSLLQDGDLDFQDDYRALDEMRQTPYRMISLPSSPVTGLWSNQFGFGAALFWAPAVLLVHLGLCLFSPAIADMLSAPYAWAVALSTAFWTGLGLLLLMRRLDRDFGPRTSVCATAAILLATPLIFYGWLHGSMSHGVSFFLAIAFLLQLERALELAGPRQIFRLGLLGGLVFVTRYQDVVWVAAVGGVAFWHHADASDTRSRARAIGWFGLGAAMLLLPQLALWNHLHGSWLSGPTPHFGYEEGGLQWTPKFLYQVLFSERGGFLAWHPVLLVGLAGLIGMRASFSKPVWAAAVGGLLLQIYLISSWSGWYGGASFGNRFFISSYPWIAFGLAASLHRAALYRPWIPIVAVILLALWNGGLLLQYGLQMVPRSDAVSWLVVFSNQFNRVPTWLLERAGF